MIVKVVAMIALLKVCVAESPTHLQPQSNQAISSQSFVRHDVPLSYKYSWVHVYTTPQPNRENKYKPDVPSPQHLVRQQSAQLQYAPIVVDQHAHQYNSPNAIDSVPEKTNIEPKPSRHSQNVPKAENELYHHHHEHLSYVPGYNIEVLQTVNKFPGHNPVYRSYPNMSSSERLNKINYLNQYVRSQNKDEEFKTTPVAPIQHNIATQTPSRSQPTVTSFVPLRQPILSVAEQYHGTQGARYPHNVLMMHSGPQQLAFNIPKGPAGLNQTHSTNLQSVSSGHQPHTQNLGRNSLEHHQQHQYVPVFPAGPQPPMNIQEYVPHPKAHKMLLNIARTYNFAHALAKAQHGLTLNNPSHTQAFIQMRRPIDPEKSHLLSVQNKNLYSPVHRTP